MTIELETRPMAPRTAVHASEGPSAQPITQMPGARPPSTRMTGLRTTALTVIGATAVGLLGAAQSLIGLAPDLFGTGPAHAQALAVALGALNAGTAGAILGLMAFSFVPALERLVHRAEVDRERLADLLDETRMQRRQIQSMEKRAIDHATRQGAREDTRRGPSVRPMRPESFQQDAPGEVSTFEPGLITEIGGGLLPSGDIQVYPMMPDSLPPMFNRLRDEDGATIWRVFICLEHNVECLERIIKFVYALDTFARRGIYKGTRLDLGKLEVRVLNQPATGVTKVVTPKWDLESGEIFREVLSYDQARRQKGRPKLSVVRGIARRDVCDLETLALQTAPIIKAGALQLFLGACVPRDGIVPASAVTEWLATSPPTLTQLLAFRGGENFPAAVE